MYFLSNSIRLSAVGALLLSGTAALAAHPVDPSHDEANVIAINKAVFDAVKKVDEDRFRALTHDQLRVLAPGGRLEDKEMVVAGLGTVVGDLAHSDQEVTIVGDTAILTGKMEGEAVMEPLGKLPPMKYIATFVRTDDGWRMLSRSITPCAPVAIERGVC